MRVKLTIQLLALIAGAAALAALAAAATAPAPADDITGPEMFDFKAQLENFDPPNEMQVKTLLEGAKAQPRSAQIWITSARLKMYRTNGTLEMLAEAPHCIYDTEQRTVSSSGPVQINGADKNFMLEGVGFLLLQTNSFLFISNHVHTVVRNTTGRAPNR